MWGLKPNNQTGKVKHTEFDEKTPTRFSRTRNSPFSWGLKGVCSCALDLGFISSSHPPGLTGQHLHTAGSGVKPELTSQRGFVPPAILTFFCSALDAGQHCLMNEENIWSHNCSCGLHGAGLRQLLTAECAHKMLLSVLLLEFSISIPKCVKTKIIQVFTLLY